MSKTAMWALLLLEFRRQYLAHKLQCAVRPPRRVEPMVTMREVRGE